MKKATNRWLKFLGGTDGIIAHAPPLRRARSKPLRASSLREPARSLALTPRGFNPQPTIQKAPAYAEAFCMAGLTGFEPATSSVTGRRALRCSTVPHLAPGASIVKYRGNHTNSGSIKQFLFYRSRRERIDTLSCLWYYLRHGS